MNADADFVLTQLAQRFDLERGRLRCPGAFEQAITAALALVPASVLIDEVAGLGGLGAARDPWAVLLSRVRRLPEFLGELGRQREEQVEAARWQRVDRAAKRGETLRALVARGDLGLDEAGEQLGADFQSDSDLLAIARAALTGGAR